MVYRTRTYIAGDWTGDIDLIRTIYDRAESDHWALSFSDAHALTQARDTSLPCSIKSSLKERLDGSKTFVLIVGDHTRNLTKGGCRHCSSYSSFSGRCLRGRSVDNRSFIAYECEVARRDIDNIVVLYNSTSVDKKKCPDVLQSVGVHIPAYTYSTDFRRVLNYSELNRYI